MINWPTKLGGSKTLFAWLNRFLAAAKGAQVVSSSTVIVEEQSERGTKLRVVLPSDGGGRYPFKLCRNGQQITVRLNSNVDPATTPDDAEE